MAHLFKTAPFADSPAQNPPARSGQVPLHARLRPGEGPVSLPGTVWNRGVW